MKLINNSKELRGFKLRVANSNTQMVPRMRKSVEATYNDIFVVVE